MERIRTIIVEDEAPARRLIREFLEDYPEVELIGECGDGYEGAKKILETGPDLVFLDIQMPRVNGFEMLELLTGENMPLIIFTTAYDNFAIKAFDFNTCDYLLKPIGKDRFGKAMQKALDRLKEKNLAENEKINRIVDQGIAGGGYLHRLVIRSGSQVQIVHCNDVLCLEADDDNIIIHCEKERWQKNQTLKFYENKLDPNDFLRVHRSFIVRVTAIKKIEPYSKDAFIAVLTNGLKISVSKKGYSRLREQFGF
jgi:two-component system, LytTR family, response regulator